MAPLLLNVAASLAGNVIDSVSEHLSRHAASHKVRKAAAAVDFAGELAKLQQPPTTTATPATPAAPEIQTLLMNRVLGAPEIASALGTADPSHAVQLEMSSTGNVSIRGASGSLHQVNVSENTRALVAGLYAGHQPAVVAGKSPGVAILAVDPTHAVAPMWSTLPVRTTV